jgi:hypothetical protein
VPTITAGVLFRGGDGAIGPSILLAAAAIPPALAALTTTLMRAPSSDLPGVYVRLVARAITLQLRPRLRESCQLYVKRRAAVQTPGKAVSFCPRIGTPLTEGRWTFRGR